MSCSCDEHVMHVMHVMHAMHVMLVAEHVMLM